MFFALLGLRFRHLQYACSFYILALESPGPSGIPSGFSLGAHLRAACACDPHRRYKSFLGLPVNSLHRQLEPKYPSRHEIDTQKDQTTLDSWSFNVLGGLKLTGKKTDNTRQLTNGAPVGLEACE